jgi:soluble lytic murein transglycosylase-like protein
MKKLSLINILNILFIIILFCTLIKCIDIKLKKEKEMIKQNYNDKLTENFINDKKQFKQNMIKSLYYLKSNADPKISNKIVDSIIKNANENNMPPLLILCLIFQESSFNHLASNKYNAIGLMQIIPKYHQEKIDNYCNNIDELYHIDNNIAIGTLILKEYFNKSENIIKALQKYVGALVKENASKYIENILNNYITLQIKFF